MENNQNEQVEEKSVVQKAENKPEEPQKKCNGFSIAALVLGLAAIIGAFIPYVTYVAWLFGILAIVFGAIGMKKSKETNSGHGLAVAGLVLGIVSTVFAVIGFICIVVIVGAAYAGGMTSI